MPRFADQLPQHRVKEWLFAKLFDFVGFSVRLRGNFGHCYAQ